MPWALAAAAVTVGGQLLASNNASDAAQTQANATAAGAAAATAEQKREFDLIQSETQPNRDIGNAATGAIGSAFGLPGYGNGVSMTGANAPKAANDPYFGYNIPHGSTPAPAPASGPAPAPSMTGSPQGAPVAVAGMGQAGGGPGTGTETPVTAPMTGKAPGPPVPGSTPQTVGIGDPIAPPAAGTTPAATPPANSTPAQQVPDWNAFLQANPDVMQWAQSGHGDPNVPIDQQSIEQRAAYWVQNANTLGDPRGKQPLPMMDAPAAPSTGTTAAGGGPAPGYTDPTAPNGYTVGARPDIGPAPSPYVSATRPMTSPLDVSEGAYHQSPGYQFQVSQAQKQLGNLSSSMGGVMSGARIAASLQRANDLANTDYTDWRNYTTGQYNEQQNRGDNIYNSDRAFGYGQSQDALSQYDLNRTRSDGLYADDRSYAAGRSDTRNNQLMTLAGFGQSATNTSANAAQNFATNAGNNIMTAAAARGNAAINSANAWTAGANNVMNVGAYLGGQYMTGGMGSNFGYSPSGYYNASDPVLGVT